MIALLDVNVLVPLFDGGHVHHHEAHDWFAESRSDGWASCPVTENGMLRVLSNPAQPAWYVPIAELRERLGMFCEGTEHHFWADHVSLRDAELFNVQVIRGHRQLTDVYLLGLAVRNGGRLVTFDSGIPLAAVKGAGKQHLHVLAPSE